MRDNSLPNQLETRSVEVTLKAVGAWEVWKVEVPADATDEWIKDHYDECEKWWKDAGATSYEVTEISRD